MDSQIQTKLMIDVSLLKLSINLFMMQCFIIPVYYNILHSSTQGTNQAGTRHQEVALAKSDDAQAIQNSSEGCYY